MKKFRDVIVIKHETHGPEKIEEWFEWIQDTVDKGKAQFKTKERIIEYMKNKNVKVTDDEVFKKVYLND